MTAAYDTILELLPKLSKEEITQLKGRLSILHTYTSNSQEEEDDWLLRGISRVAGDRGFAAEIPKYLHIANNRSYRGYRDKARKVRDMFEQEIRNLTKSEKAVLGQLLAECLCAKLQEYRAVSFLALMHSVEQIPEAFEASFPSYLRNRRASAVLRGMAKARINK